MRTHTCSSFKQADHDRGGGLSLQTLSSEEGLRRAPFLTVLGTQSVSRSFPLPPHDDPFIICGKLSSSSSCGGRGKLRLTAHASQPRRRPPAPRHTHNYLETEPRRTHPAIGQRSYAQPLIPGRPRPRPHLAPAPISPSCTSSVIFSIQYLWMSAYCFPEVCVCLLLQDLLQSCARGGLARRTFGQLFASSA